MALIIQNQMKTELSGVINFKYCRTATVACTPRDEKTRVPMGSAEVFLTYQRNFRKGLTSMKPTTTICKQASKGIAGKFSHCIRHVHLSDVGLTLFHDRYSMTEGGVRHGEVCKG